jgi:hypothetical protein
MLMIGVLLAAAFPSPLRAAKMIYGDIQVSIVAEPHGSGSHGYMEYVVAVENTSQERAHRVTLTIPHEPLPVRMDSIRSLSRSVDVGPGRLVRVSLLQPDLPAIYGRGLAVTVDGLRGEDPVPLNPAQTQGAGWMYYRFMSSTAEPLVLLGRGAEGSFQKHAPYTATSGRGMPMPMPITKGMPAGGPPGGPRMPVAPVAAQLVRSDLPPEMWSGNWLAYSRYDGIVVTDEDLAVMPSETKTALWQYVETGGCLLVLGQAELPPGWKRQAKEDVFAVYQGGFGSCLTTANRGFERWPHPRWAALAHRWAETARPWQGERNTIAAHQKFPVVDNVGIPVKGLFLLMLLFTILIGPVNLFVLARKRRRLWLLWTVPAISLLTCLAVFGYMVLAEGWEGRLRTEGLTLLDESSHRATSIGWTAFYSPLTPGDGLHFSPQTEVFSQRASESYRSGARACTLDWTGDQHLAQGWVEARVPAHFRLRKSETRRERLTVSRSANGTLTAVNGLKADVTRLWLADDDGRLYTAEQVGAGSPAVLHDTGETVPEMPSLPPRDAYLSDNWPAKLADMTDHPTRYLRPGSYLADCAGAPFFEDGLRNARSRKCRSLVLGILGKQS